MTTSYLFDRSVPSNQWTLPTQSTAFGSSSLAAASMTAIAYDPGSQIYQLRQLTPGNSHANNMVIYDMDKSSLGIETRRRQAGVMFTKPDPYAITVPNVFCNQNGNSLR